MFSLSAKKQNLNETKELHNNRFSIKDSAITQ